MTAQVPNAVTFAPASFQTSPLMTIDKVTSHLTLGVNDVATPECVHYDSVAALHAHVMTPVPELSVSARLEPNVALVEEQARAAMFAERERATRRCVVDHAQLLRPLSMTMGHLMTRPLSYWFAGAGWNASQAPVSHLFIGRDETRYMRVLAVTETIKRDGGIPIYTVQPVLLSDAAILEVARQWHAALLERARRATATIDNVCLCLAHFGIMRSGMHLVFANDGQWHLWHVHGQRSAANAKFGASNMTFSNLLSFPYELHERVMGSNTLTSHWESVVLSVTDVAATLDVPGGDVYVDALEPRWLLATTSTDTDTMRPPDEHPLLAVFALAQLLPTPKEHTLDVHDSGCFAYCQAFETTVLTL